MSSIGPQLPPHLTKRKRTPEEDDNDAPSKSPVAKSARTAGPQLPNQHEIDLDDDDSDDNYGPKIPSGPQLPAKNKEEIDLDSDSDSDVGPAPPKPSTTTSSSIGPSMPPPPKPDADSDHSDSDSEDDYGPAPPGSSKAVKPIMGPAMPPSALDNDTPQRDDWMLAPPTGSGYAESDPTRIRARKFASKPSSSSTSKPGGGGAVSSIWTETPEQKLKRLQDAVLGRTDPAGESGLSAAEQARVKEEEERNRIISANISATRGKSLVEQHSQRRKEKGTKPEEEEDDPSKRGFDREKDMALGGKLGTAQRRELMSKAADFGGRFSKGSFL